MRSPDVPTTPEQWSVITWSAIVIFVGLGAVGLYYAERAPAVPAAAAEAADQMRRLSFGCWGVAAAVYVCKRTLTRLLT